MMSEEKIKEVLAPFGITKETGEELNTEELLLLSGMISDTFRQTAEIMQNAFGQMSTVFAEFSKNAKEAGFKTSSDLEKKIRENYNNPR